MKKSFNFSGTDDYYGDYSFSISNVEVTKDFEGTGSDAIQFTLATENGSDRFLEWINKSGDAERTDSHIRTNESERLWALFKPEHLRQPAPNVSIYEALDEVLLELK